MEVSRKERSWVVDIENLLAEDAAAGDLTAAEAATWRKHSIYRVPTYIKNGKHTACPYGPQLVSLGPFHCDNPDLPPMDEHKQRALLHLLRRTGSPVRSLVAALEQVVEQLEEAYMDLEDGWRRDRDAFLRVMVMDGCFLLEVMRTAAADGDAGDYAHNDPVFSRHGDLYLFPYVRRDMLVMENQLPLLVLQKLVAALHGPDAATDDAINNMVLQFVSLSPDPPELRGGGLALHPIDVCHRSLLHGAPNQAFKGRRDEFVPSATELDQAGIQFARSSTHSLHDIHFAAGVLHIPELAVDETTEHKLLSLMAFERLHADAGTPNEVTAYVFFMDNVIKCDADATLLCARGVLSNGLGSDKEVAKMFNRLGQKAVLDKGSTLRAVHGEVNAYRDTRWNQWRASLIQNHAGNPWAIVSLAAAVFLLVLTVVQTVYTVLPYYDDQQPTSRCGARIYLHDEL
ncbi:hypothetical protein HU200_053106 [Digitaria exilis]|uniref:Uncharacterized protein n=1 Tax=Digitaria exilis TaxID=1010633 RepID=A0A835AQ60_9POAL|nr:hypothetical protein HU200_053106 [Digitaria exilis]CAB3484502.1 unnamed protein product [Digitaria exilis]